MIITLHEEDREAILDYVSAEPEMNLFFIGDIDFTCCTARMKSTVWSRWRSF